MEPSSVATSLCPSANCLVARSVTANSRKVSAPFVTPILVSSFQLMARRVILLSFRVHHSTHSYSLRQQVNCRRVLRGKVRRDIESDGRSFYRVFYRLFHDDNRPGFVVVPPESTVVRRCQGNGMPDLVGKGVPYVVVNKTSGWGFSDGGIDRIDKVCDP